MKIKIFHYVFLINGITFAAPSFFICKFLARFREVVINDDFISADWGIARVPSFRAVRVYRLKALKINGEMRTQIIINAARVGDRFNINVAGV